MVMYLVHMNRIRNYVQMYNENTYDNHVNDQDINHQDEIYS